MGLPRAQGPGPLNGPLAPLRERETMRAWVEVPSPTARGGGAGKGEPHDHWVQLGAE